MRRRDFLKLAGLALAGTGCSRRSTLLPFLAPAEDVVPGVPTWYATTCRECPAGCGVLARCREGRVIKLEGHPEHPVNRGALCARGQAALQGLYHPERLAAPLMKSADGRLEPVTWDEALKRLRERLAAAGGRIAALTGVENGFLDTLVRRWLASHGASAHVRTAFLDAGPLREGAAAVSNLGGVPHPDLSKADFFLSLGADFLGTWLSPVEFSRQFAEARAGAAPGAGAFVFVGPRLSLTAASADRWIPVRPGREAFVGYAILAAFREEHGRDLEQTMLRGEVETLLAGRTAADLAGVAGVSVGEVRALARALAAAKNPLCLPGDDAASAAVAFLLTAAGGGAGNYRQRSHAVHGAATRSQVADFVAALADGRHALVLVHRANPVPADPAFAEALARGPFVVALSSFLDETSSLASLVLPVHHPLESWGAYQPRDGLTCYLQPVMRPRTASRDVCEILLDTLREGPGEDSLRTLVARESAPRGEAGFRERIRRGFSSDRGAPAAWAVSPDGRLSLPPDPPPPAEGRFDLVAYPSPKFGDGRGANLSWLQELPDPTTRIAWGDWLELHPEDAAALGLREGDLARVTSGAAAAELPIHLYPGIARGVAAAPLGAQGGAVWSLTGPARVARGVAIARGAGRRPPAHTDGSATQHGRAMARAVGDGDHGHGHEAPLRLPLPEGRDGDLDVYPGHRYDGPRWAMSVDLDRCTGCGACAVACQAENNIPVVGRARVLEGREMSWLQVERFWEPGSPPALRFLPVLCQHCEAAPCEAVCPVFAPHHDHEGLNVQVYNRCVGTRFCAVNCPYKVRRFNWVTYEPEGPLRLQLNPDVTVRTKGVMEKCSFCVQRIKEARRRARGEKRPIRDGEIVPACAQTCPTRALVFGNLRDPGAAVAARFADPRAYSLLGELNTRPAVAYLKRVPRRV